MADYRDWCSSCGNEINYGGHKPGCQWVREQNEARAKAQAEYDAKLEVVRNLPKDELLAKAAKLHDTMDALHRQAGVYEREFAFYREAMLREGVLGDYLDYLRDQRKEK